MKLNGYRPSHRNRWILLKEDVISKEGLMFWEYCLDQMSFDTRNKKYGTAEISFEEVMTIFRITSRTTVRNWYKELIMSGFVREIDKVKHILEIPNCERYVEGRNGRVGEYAEKEKDQSIGKIKQSIGLNCQFNDANNQSTDQNLTDIGTISGTKALCSFKVDLSSSSKGGVKTMEEYCEIYRKGNWGHFTPEDMMWVDKNQGLEQKAIKSEIKELSDQDIADVFFDGDMASYLAHRIV